MSRTSGAYRTVLVRVDQANPNGFRTENDRENIHNMLALINPAALPALRIAATFFFSSIWLAAPTSFAIVTIL